jgi:hypothetical protein
MVMMSAGGGADDDDDDESGGGCGGGGGGDGDGDINASDDAAVPALSLSLLHCRLDIKTKPREFEQWSFNGYDDNDDDDHTDDDDDDDEIDNRIILMLNKFCLCYVLPLSTCSAGWWHISQRWHARRTHSSPPGRCFTARKKNPTTRTR